MGSQYLNTNTFDCVFFFFYCYYFLFYYRAQWVEPDPAFLYDSLIDMGKHVGSLGFNIWKDMKDHIKCCKYSYIIWALFK